MLLGLVLGLVAASLLTGVIESQLYGVTSTDPWTFAGVSAVLLMVAFLACYLPARQAGRTDPVAVLRSQ